MERRVARHRAAVGRRVMVMEGAHTRTRGLGGQTADSTGPPHLAFAISSARSAPVRGRRGSGLAAWEDLAQLVDQEHGEARRQPFSQQPLPRVGERGLSPAGLSRTYSAQLDSSRSENARSLYAPQPRSAWTDHQQPATRGAPEQLSVDLGRGTPRRPGTSGPRTQGRAADRPWTPSWVDPSPQHRRTVATNDSAMAQGAEDFLSASLGFLREYNQLARLGLAQGNLTVAQENLEQARELIQQGGMASTEIAAVTYNLFGCMYRRMGRLDEAMDYLQQALHILEPRQRAGALVERDVDVADVHMNMSSAQSAMQHHDDALRHVDEAIALLTARLGLTPGQAAVDGFSSEQDIKDVRMLVIAHYNRGSEMRTLKQDSTPAFAAAMQLADDLLPPDDALRLMIRKAQRRASREESERVGAPPGVKPLRLSMLNGQNTAPRGHVQHGDADKGQNSCRSSSRRSAASVASVATPLTGRSQLTPQGWHTLHPVHRGNFASSARRSARDRGVEEDRKDVHVTSTHMQTGLVKHAHVRSRTLHPSAGDAEAPPRNVFRRKERVYHGARDPDRPTPLDENDAVLEMAQAHDIFSLVRAWPDSSVLDRASRYVPQGGIGKGLYDYGHALDQSLVKKPKQLVESGTQVEQAAWTGTASGPDCENSYVTRRDRVQSVEEMVSQHARQQLHAGDSSRERGRGVWGRRSAGGGGDGGGVGGRHAGLSQGYLDRTYKSHLERTRQAHLRYNQTALVLQLAYRGHLARQAAIELQRNPQHLKTMMAKQIQAFAALLQNNVRCMLAKRWCAKMAGRRMQTAQDRWRIKRDRAAIFIQAWFCRVVGVRQRKAAGFTMSADARAAAVVQRAFRCHCARERRSREHTAKAQHIQAECSLLQRLSVVKIQCLVRRTLAWRRFAALADEDRRLRAQPGVRYIGWLWGGDGLALSGPQLRLAMAEQETAVAALQQSVLRCLEHRAWLQRAGVAIGDLLATEATRIQSAWRHREAKRIAIDRIREFDRECEQHRAQEAAATVQRAWLCRGGRRRFKTLYDADRARASEAAASDIQRCPARVRSAMRARRRTRRRPCTRARTHTRTRAGALAHTRVRTRTNARACIG